MCLKREQSRVLKKSMKTEQHKIKLGLDGHLCFWSFSLPSVNTSPVSRESPQTCSSVHTGEPTQSYMLHKACGALPVLTWAQRGRELTAFLDQTQGYERHQCPVSLNYNSRFKSPIILPHSPTQQLLPVFSCFLFKFVTEKLGVYALYCS